MENNNYKNERFDETKKYFAGDSFAVGMLGIEIMKVDKNYALCKMKLTDRHLNAAGNVMGGATYTLVDLTFAVAANSLGVSTVTAASNMAFLAVAKGDCLIAEAKVIKEGRTSSLYQVDVVDDLGNMIAHATMTGAHIKNKE